MATIELTTPVTVASATGPGMLGAGYPGTTLTWGGAALSPAIDPGQEQGAAYVTLVGTGGVPVSSAAPSFVDVTDRSMRVLGQVNNDDESRLLRAVVRGMELLLGEFQIGFTDLTEAQFSENEL